MRHLSFYARFAILAGMEVRAKKALGQHFLTDQKVARAIVDALQAAYLFRGNPRRSFPGPDGPGNNAGQVLERDEAMTMEI